MEQLVEPQDVVSLLALNWLAVPSRQATIFLTHSDRTLPHRDMLAVFVQNIA
jgi:hypothetical protein